MASMPEKTGNGEGLAAADIAVMPVIKRAGRAVALAVGDGEAVESLPIKAIDLTLEGIPGDRHGGFVRRADVRVPWFPRGEPIHNERQLTIVSAEELAAIAGSLGLAAIRPEWLGANLLVEGIRNFSAIPRGTRLFFPSGATLAVTDLNKPCRLAGGALVRATGGDEGLALRFVAASKRLRGVTAYVDRAGTIRVGDAIAVRVPEQWIWPG